MWPSIVIGKWAFDSLRLYWAKKIKNHNVCYYIYHVKMEELRVGLNHMQQKVGLHLGLLVIVKPFVNLFMIP